MQNVKSLVIGAAGFVGGYLLDELKASGRTTVATKLPSEKLNTAANKVLDLDVTDAKATAALIAAELPDEIYHLAAQSSVKLSWGRPALTLNVNVLGALNVLDACRAVEGYFPTVLMIGSAEEYGKVTPDMCPISEDTSTAPENIYALSKSAQNGIARIYSSAYKMKIINVRAFNHTGPGQATAFVVSDFCSQVALIEKGEKEPIMSVGNLDARRDFTDVRDIVRAYVALAENGEAGQTYNVGSGKAVSIKEVLDVILSKAKCKIEVQRDPARMRPSDVPLHCADTSKINKKTGWTPVIPLEKTIEDTLNYFRAK